MKERRLPINQANKSEFTERAQDLQQVLRVPRGFSGECLDELFVGGLAHQVEGEMPDDGHFFDALTGSQPRLILVESHVDGPVQVVLDGPMDSHRVSQGFGRDGARGDVGSPFGLDLVLCPRSIRLSTTAVARRRWPSRRRGRHGGLAIRACREPCQWSRTDQLRQKVLCRNSFLTSDARSAGRPSRPGGNRPPRR